MREAFIAGWEAAFRYCNPDVGFQATADNAEDAYTMWQPNTSDTQTALKLCVDYLVRAGHATDDETRGGAALAAAEIALRGYK